ncbi:Lipopolysaccharide-modifying protein [Artemisia annua]|uniref:Lipopolysaccharide-modifying protein n=1 Tax=Artemisia annua TaxID=35608 RepID=A0A2U1MV87_ARTAN|nr:Lipopolysaccharide-modifying protein [Artemisia annua]
MAVSVQQIGKAASRFIQEDVKMDNVYDYMFHLLTAYSKLMKYKPTVPENATELCSETKDIDGGDATTRMMAVYSGAGMVMVRRWYCMKVYLTEAPLTWQCDDCARKARNDTHIVDLNHGKLAVRHNYKFKQGTSRNNHLKKGILASYEEGESSEDHHDNNPMNEAMRRDGFEVYERWFVEQLEMQRQGMDGGVIQVALRERVRMKGMCWQDDSFVVADIDAKLGTDCLEYIQRRSLAPLGRRGDEWRMSGILASYEEGESSEDHHDNNPMNEGILASYEEGESSEDHHDNNPMNEEHMHQWELEANAREEAREREWQ